jgi:hypothetical protein
MKIDLCARVEFNDLSDNGVFESVFLMAAISVGFDERWVQTLVYDYGMVGEFVHQAVWLYVIVQRLMRAECSARKA